MGAGTPWGEGREGDGRGGEGRSGEEWGGEKRERGTRMTPCQGSIC